MSQNNIEMLVDKHFINSNKSILMKIIKVERKKILIHIKEGFAKGYVGMMEREYFDGPKQQWREVVNTPKRDSRQPNRKSKRRSGL